MQSYESDYIVPEFQFNSGQTLAELRLHYTTLGEPRYNNQGKTTNAIWIGHGTTGNGHQFLGPKFADELFGPGQLLDTTKYYIILPDGIGHGKSSKPSDGLRAKFPTYDYHDMVRAQYHLITDHLKVNHLHLIMGTSMGGMHSWIWGYTYPGLMDYLFPLACLPVEIAGRNRMMRKMLADAIRNDPDWNSGNYKVQPSGLISALHILLIMTSVPLQWQKSAPTRNQAELMLENKLAQYAAKLDANDVIYQFEASKNYNPYPHLKKIAAPLLAINSADDQVNPPELGIMEQAIKQVSNGKYVLLPITDETRGHSTHTLAKLWKHQLAQFISN